MHKREPQECFMEHIIRQSDDVHGGRLTPWAWSMRWIDLQQWLSTIAASKAYLTCRQQFRTLHKQGKLKRCQNRQSKVDTECWYCGKKGHRESECWKKQADSDKAGSSGRDAERPQKSHYTEGSERAGNGPGPTFLMQHKAT